MAALAAEALEFERASKALAFTGRAERRRLVEWGLSIADRLERIVLDDSWDPMAPVEKAAALEQVAGMRRDLAEVT